MQHQLATGTPAIARPQLARGWWPWRLAAYNGVQGGSAQRGCVGDCNVPVHWAEDPRLGSWAKKQRVHKKKLDRGEDSEGMMAERARAVKASKVKLDALGFVCWNPRRAGPSRSRGSAHSPRPAPASSRYAWRGALGSDGTWYSGGRGASRSGFCRHRCAGGVSAGRARRPAVRRRPVVRRHRARCALAAGAPLGPLAARPFR